MEKSKQYKYDVAYLKWQKNGLIYLIVIEKIGALIVKDQMIISDGYNGTPSGFSNECEDENNQHIGMYYTQKQTLFLKLQNQIIIVKMRVYI